MTYGNKINYRYTLFYENEQTGVPPMRPLFYEFPDQPTLFAKEDEYMVSKFSSSFIVFEMI